MYKLLDKEPHPKDEIQDLVEKVNHHNKLYHNGNETEISDYEYDIMLNRLRDLESRFPEYIVPNSPSYKIGSELERHIRGEKHIRPMLSLSNTYNEKDISEFWQRACKLLNVNNVDIYSELKIDGVAASLIYENGKLLRALTRGDGEYGENILDAVKTISTIPKQFLNIKINGIVEVRGEIYISKETFKKLNKDRLALAEIGWANARNLASGTLKTIDIDIIKQRGLEFIPYSLHTDEKIVSTQLESMKILSKIGFFIPSTSVSCSTKHDIMSYISKWDTERHFLDYNTDGVVLKINSLEEQQILGASAHSPRWAVAYKYKPESEKTRLLDVVFQIGRTGAITPVAILEPIFIAGTTVKRASLYNKEYIERIDLHIGDTVFVEKGGDIIPKISKVDKNLRPAGSKMVVFPKNCPSCNSTIIKNDGEAAYYCHNKNCEPQLKAALAHFVSRSAMDIETMGKKTIDLLYEHGLLSSFVDIYKLQYENINGLPGFKKQASDNLLESISLSKRQPMSKLLFALGIKHVGIVASETLSKFFKSFDKIMDASLDELASVKDIGSRTANAIVDYFFNQDNVRQIIELGKYGLPMQISGSSEQKKTLFSEKAFVITGTFQGFSREEIIGLIKKHGGKVLSAISSNTDFLVVGTDPGESKLNRAFMSNIKIISEKDLREMIV